MTYEYFLVNTHTGRIVDELAGLAGVRFSEGLSQAGTLTGRLPMSSRSANLNALAIGQREIMVVRSGRCVWTGPISARNPASGVDGDWVSITASTPEWYAGKRSITSNLSLNGSPDVSEIVRRIWSHITDERRGGALPGIEIQTGDVGRTVAAWRQAGSARKLALQAITDLAQRDGTGFEWRWNFGWDETTGARTATLRLGAPSIGRTIDDYPLERGGPAVISISTEEDVEQSATTIHLQGGKRSDTGQQITVTIENEAALDAGAARVEKVISRGDIDTVDEAHDVAVQMMRRLAPPLVRTTVTAYPAAQHPFGSVRPGDRIVMEGWHPLVAPDGPQRVETVTVAVGDDGDEQITYNTEPHVDGMTGGASARYGGGSGGGGGSVDPTTAGGFGRYEQGSAAPRSGEILDILVSTTGYVAGVDSDDGSTFFPFGPVADGSWVDISCVYAEHMPSTLPGGGEVIVFPIIGDFAPANPGGGADALHGGFHKRCVLAENRGDTFGLSVRMHYVAVLRAT